MKHSIRNPRNGKHDSSVEFTAPGDLLELTQALRSNQKAWQAMSLTERTKVLFDFKTSLLEVKEELINELSDDTGRYTESVIEFDAVINSIENWSLMAVEELQETAPKQANINYIEIGKQYVPYPLIGVISPWNFPFLLSLIDAIPALFAGCSVIIKPSEVTPRFTRSLIKAISSTPYLKGILTIVLGNGELGAKLIKHVDGICFTGSVETGRKVAIGAAAQLIPAFLELGGKDAALVFDDVDLDRTAASLTWGSMANAGQVCLSIERVYVHQKVYNELANKLSTNVSNLTLCSGETWREGQIGPIISEPQAHIIQAQFDDARSKGANILCGGNILNIDGGLWCEPTVIINVDHSMSIATEETFGPILCLIKFSDEMDALSLANNSQYGLSAAVFSNDIERAYRVARSLDAGGISINDCSLTGMVRDGEKDAFKSSGLGGSRMGPTSIKRFIRNKALLLNTNQTWNNWWF